MLTPSPGDPIQESGGLSRCSFLAEAMPGVKWLWWPLHLRPFVIQFFPLAATESDPRQVSAYPELYFSAALQFGQNRRHRSCALRTNDEEFVVYQSMQNGLAEMRKGVVKLVLAVERRRELASFIAGGNEHIDPRTDRQSGRVRPGA